MFRPQVAGHDVLIRSTCTFVAVLMAVLAAGCGADDDPAATTPATNATQTPPSHNVASTQAQDIAQLTAEVNALRQQLTVAHDALAQRDRELSAAQHTAQTTSESPAQLPSAAAIADLLKSMHEAGHDVVMLLHDETVRGGIVLLPDHCVIMLLDVPPTTLATVKGGTADGAFATVGRCRLGMTVLPIASRPFTEMRIEDGPLLIARGAVKQASQE